MQILLLIGQIFLGIIFFWVFDAHKYIGKSFDWRKWKDKNLVLFVWSLIICTLFALILTVDESSASYVMAFMNINVDDSFSYSGVITGIMIGYATRRIGGPKKNESNTIAVMTTDGEQIGKVVNKDE